MTTLPNATGVPGPGPSLSQVDPPASFSRTALRIVLALLVVCGAIAAYVYLGRDRPTARGEVSRVSVYPVHTVIRGAIDGAPGTLGQDQSYDQLLVLAIVRVRNEGGAPVKIDDIWAITTLPDGVPHRSLAASEADFARVFAAYPQLKPLKTDPLRRDVTIQPGESVDGLAIFNYPFGQSEWNTRKSMNVTLAFSNARELTLRSPQG